MNYLKNYTHIIGVYGVHAISDKKTEGTSDNKCPGPLCGTRAGTPVPGYLARGTTTTVGLACATRGGGGAGTADLF